MRKALGILALLVIGFIVFVGVVLSPPKDRADRANRESGDRVVKALQAFHTSRGKYPKELSELAPEFISPIPQQVRRNGSGLSFHYELAEDKSDSFVLSYDEAPLGMFNSDAAFEYNSRSGAWEHHTY